MLPTKGKKKGGGEKASSVASYCEQPNINLKTLFEYLPVNGREGRGGKGGG
jgi:hypothetical protein